LSRAVIADGLLDVFHRAGFQRPDIAVLSDEFLESVRAIQQRNPAIETLRYGVLPRLVVVEVWEPVKIPKSKPRQPRCQIPASPTLLHPVESRIFHQAEKGG
jgi:hypothetical protein